MTYSPYLPQGRLKGEIKTSDDNSHQHYRSDGPGVGYCTFHYDGVMRTGMAQFLVRINTFWVGELKVRHSHSMTVVSDHAAADSLEVLLQFFGNIK